MERKRKETSVISGTRKKNKLLLMKKEELENMTLTGHIEEKWSGSGHLTDSVSEWRNGVWERWFLNFF